MAEPPPPTGPQRRAIDPMVGAAVAELAADLREWLAWAAETGAVEVPSFESPATGTPAAAQPALARPATVASHAQARARHSPPAAAAPSRPAPPAAVTARQPAGGETLEQVRADLGACTRCPLHQGRRHLVFGVGNPVADLMLIGEAPGRQEDLTGEPFVGRSGQLLSRMLAAIGLERSSVYICNVIKCRPPNNRDPEPNEVACCSPFLHRQILAVRPRVILALGRFAAWNLTGSEGHMGELRRQVSRYEDIPVVVSYHPSYLLRTPVMKRAAWEDLLRVRALLSPD